MLAVHAPVVVIGESLQLQITVVPGGRRQSSLGFSQLLALRVALAVLDVGAGHNCATAVADVLKHLADDVLVGHVLVFVLLFLAVVVLVVFAVHVVVGALLKLAVPDLLDLVNLLFAELDPATCFGVLQTGLLVHAFFLLVAALVVDRALSEVAEFKGDLDDLAHVHARGLESRGELEVRLGIQLNLHESFEGVDVLLIECFLQRVEDHDGLLMGDRAEGELLDHVQHSVNDALLQQKAQYFVVFDVEAFAQRHKQSLKQFNCSDTHHTHTFDGSARLVGVTIEIVVLTEQNHAVVGHVWEMGAEGLVDLLFALI